ncbi:hypothetical protein CTAYLR_009609 [Chrysophaeum taylorii]|uniref:Uncharacterized protein n=1 Tax=Chrysophaeum taylorii TaxID=2483200 RepID=A0AAD7XRY9_9STRA|nr:hypothetical protein CTAYLR_009609 [Chrysophaeum taylorii]
MFDVRNDLQLRRSKLEVPRRRRVERIAVKKVSEQRLPRPVRVDAGVRCPLVAGSRLTFDTGFDQSPERHARWFADAKGDDVTQRSRDRAGPRTHEAAASDDASVDDPTYLRNLFQNPAQRAWQTPCSWWYDKLLSKTVVAALARQGIYVSTESHWGVRNIYGRADMYYVFVAGATTCALTPSEQYAAVEMAVVRRWDTGSDVLHQRDTDSYMDSYMDGDIEGVRAELERLLRNVDAARRCGTATEFADAVRWLIETKELPELRKVVCPTQEAAPSRLPRPSHDESIVVRLVLALPESARDWWYSMPALGDELRRRGAEDDDGDEASMLTDSLGRTLPAGPGHTPLTTQHVVAVGDRISTALLYHLPLGAGDQGNSVQ